MKSLFAKSLVQWYAFKIRVLINLRLIYSVGDSRAFEFVFVFRFVFRFVFVVFVVFMFVVFVF